MSNIKEVESNKDPATKIVEGIKYTYDKSLKAWMPDVDEDLLQLQQSAYGNIQPSPSSHYSKDATTYAPNLSQKDLKQMKKEKKLEAEYKKYKRQLDEVIDDSQPQQGDSKKQKANTDEDKEGWFQLKNNTNVYVQGLPTDAVMDEIIEFFEKCGVIKREPDTGLPKIKLYTDENGQLKGDARICYFRLESVDLALKILDGQEFRPGKGNIIKVSRAVFEQKGGEYHRKSAPQKKTKKKKFDQNKMLSWDSSRTAVEDGGLPRTVILKNMFDAVELAGNGTLIGELQLDIMEECEKLGKVEKVQVFDKNPEGIVLVKFEDSKAADKCLLLMKGRYFGGRQIMAEFHDGKTNYAAIVDSNAADKEKERERERLNEYAEWLERNGQ